MGGRGKGSGFTTSSGETIETFSGGKADENTFFMGTVTTFEGRDKVPSRPPDYVSNSGSEYWYTEEGVYRRSDHWGEQIASADWFLEGKRANPDGSYREYYFDANGGYHKSKTYDSMITPIGFAKWSDFKRKADSYTTNIHEKGALPYEGWTSTKITFKEASTKKIVRNGNTYSLEWDRRGHFFSTTEI